MPRSLYVISDLHLGGEPGFQMTTGHEELAGFLQERLEEARHGSQSALELIIAGDMVDFLAETPHRALTASDAEARQKLERIVSGRSGTAEIFALLRALGQQNNARVTVMLGNHDLELVLPGPRSLLQEALGPSAVLALEGEAWRRGGLWIDHGNLVDPWNCVNHTKLRKLAAHSADFAALGEEERRDLLRVPPGSQLVVDVMNGIKQRYSFVDLLKPETQAVLPLLAVLEPDLAPPMKRALALARSVGLKMVIRNLFGASGLQVLEENMAQISAGGASSPEAAVYRELASQMQSRQCLVEEVAWVPSGDEDQVGFTETIKAWWHVWGARRAAGDQARQLERLQRALRAYQEEHAEAYDTSREGEVWLRGARRAFEAGAELVIYGHTHFAKDVQVAPGQRYLNSGTWADLMTLPDVVLDGEDEAGLEALRAFAEGLSSNELGPWRSRAPSYVKVTQGEDGAIHEAQVLLYELGGQDEPLSTQALRRRLQRGGQG